jgi:hypothetical protein
VIFHLASGLCFRSFQFGSLKYNTHSTYGRRNLFLITNPTRRQFILVKPKAKLKDEQAKTLLSFPECITDTLGFYSCVLRPVGAELTSSGSAVPQKLAMGIDLYTTFIWGPRCQKTWKSRPPRPWNRMTGGIVRQVVHAVFREKFPSLFKGSQNTNSSTISSLESGELKVYMSGLPFPAFDDTSQAECTSRFIVSEIWQGALGLAMLSLPLRKLVPHSHLFPATEFYTTAINKAQHCALQPEIRDFQKCLIRLYQEDNSMDGRDVSLSFVFPVADNYNEFSR